MHFEKEEYLRKKYGCLKALGVLPVAASQLQSVIASIGSGEDFGGSYRSALTWFRDRSSLTAVLGESVDGQEVKRLLDLHFGGEQIKRLWVVWDFSEGVDEFPANLFFEEMDQLRNPGAEDIELIEPDAGIVIGVSHFGEVWISRGSR